MLEFVIPCLLGLESLVGDEIRKLGLSDVRVENGRVLCHGEARDIEDFAEKGQFVGAMNSKSIWENWNYNKLVHN